MKAITAYIALGSNLNDPVTQLHIALTHIAKIPSTCLDACSPFYQTSPVGYVDQPAFINAAIAVCTTLSPHELLQALQEIEIQQGRLRIIKNGPRIIDLDLLLYGDMIIQEPDFVLPHPRMLERSFVLKPLADIAPNLVLRDGKTVLMYLQEQHDAYDCKSVEMMYA